MKQEEHHRHKTFKEEYLKMLTDYDVDYDDRYLLEFMIEETPLGPPKCQPDELEKLNSCKLE